MHSACYCFSYWLEILPSFEFYVLHALTQVTCSHALLVSAWTLNFELVITSSTSFFVTKIEMWRLDVRIVQIWPLFSSIHRRKKIRPISPTIIWMTFHNIDRSWRFVCHKFHVWSPTILDIAPPCLSSLPTCVHTHRRKRLATFYRYGKRFWNRRSWRGVLLECPLTVSWTNSLMNTKPCSLRSVCFYSWEERGEKKRREYRKRWADGEGGSGERREGEKGEQERGEGKWWWGGRGRRRKEGAKPLWESEEGKENGEKGERERDITTFTLPLFLLSFSRTLLIRKGQPLRHPSNCFQELRGNTGGC